LAIFLAKVNYGNGCTNKISEYTLSDQLVDVRDLDRTGRFTFDRLGRGEYLLGIMTDKETIPYNIPSEKLNIKNAPQAIKLIVTTPSRNMGEISVGF